MRQLDAELRRFFARRIVRGAFLAAALIILISVGVGTVKGHATRQRYIDPSTGQTTSQPPTGGGPVYAIVESDTRMNVGHDLDKVLEGTGVALLFVGFALGASFVGAEFNVGSLTTQLLFESRRGRVHAAKAAAVAIGTTATVLAVMLLVAVSMYIGSVTHGLVEGVDGVFVVHRSAEALRIAFAVAAGATLAYAVTLVTRRSSAGMTIFFLQFPLLNLLDPKKMPFGLISHYLPLRGLLAVTIDPTRSSNANERTIHTMAGGVVLTTVWLVIILVQSGYTFGRAEVR